MATTHCISSRSAHQHGAICTEESKKILILNLAIKFHAVTYERSASFVASHRMSQKKKAPLAGPPSASSISATGDRQAAAANNCQFLGMITASIA
jgi:hypothetical protein